MLGKGGVGKTTVSCALALHLGAKHPREKVLLISTDPAHSLGDMLEVTLGGKRKRLKDAKGNIFAWQIDSAHEFQKFLSGNRDAILNIVENGTFFSREEIAPLLDTTLPGMAEVAALLAIQELTGEDEYQHIVVDTAPFGHTLRLFELPAHFQRFLAFLEVASSRDALLAQRFGGRARRPAHAFLARWQGMVDELTAAFSAENAEILLVTSPESFSLNEAARSMKALEQSATGMKLGRIVLNRVVTEGGACPRCRMRARMSGKARRWLGKHFPGTEVLVGPDPGNPVLGVEFLRRFGETVFLGKSAKLEKKPPHAGKLEVRKVDWPVTSSHLLFTIGKGGVGKTTTTAGLAFRSRVTEKNAPVTVCSTDPAPSLDDVFQQEIGNRRSAVMGDPRLGAIEVDSVAEFRRWAGEIKNKLDSDLSMETRGVHVDLTFEKQVFAALMEVVPPGVDEVFAIFRIMELLKESQARAPGPQQQSRVLIDMAPTGHALELLRMPERMLLWSRLLLKSLAAHRTLALAQDVAVELASVGQRVRNLIAMMKDPQRSRVVAVMLPEPAPDRQTMRLLSAVAEIGSTVDSIFVNRVLVEDAGDCKRCLRRRGWQIASLHGFREKYPGQTAYLIKEFSREIAGAPGLRKLTKQLWKIAE